MPVSRHPYRMGRERIGNRNWGGVWKTHDDTKIGDLREWHLIEAACRECGWSLRFTPWAIRRVASHHVEVVGKLDRRLRCTACGARAGQLTVTLKPRD